MNRHWVFRNYAWIAVVGGGFGIAAILLFASQDKIPLLGSVVIAVLSFCYFVQQQKLAETALFKELFSEFNKRYDELNGDLAEILSLNGKSPESGLTENHRKVIIDYFNLCAEEYLFFTEGYIHPNAWQAWCAGMLVYFKREPFRSLWEEERKSGSFYGLGLSAIEKGSQLHYVSVGHSTSPSTQ